MTGNPTADLGKDRKDEFWERTSDEVADGYGAQKPTNNQGTLPMDAGKTEKERKGKVVAR